MFLCFNLPSRLSHAQAVDSLEQILSDLNQQYPSGNPTLIPLYLQLLPLQLQAYSTNLDSISKVAFRIAEKYNHDSLKLEVFRSSGAYAASVGDYGKAIEQGERGFALAQKIKSPLHPPASYLNIIGLAYAHLEEYDKSVEYYLKIIEITEARYDFDEIDILYAQTAKLNVGTMFIRQDQLEKALLYYQEALEGTLKMLEYFPDSKPVKKLHGSLLGSIGRVHFKQAETSNRPDSLLFLAKNYYESSVQTFQEINEKNNLAVGFHFLGDLYNRLDSLNKAEAYFLKSIDIRNQYKLYTTELLRAYTDLARLYEKQKAYDKALSYLDPAIELGTQLETQQMLAEAYRLKSKVLEANGQYDEAYEALLGYTGSNQAFMEEQKLAKMNELEAQFSIAQAQELREKQAAINAKLRIKRSAIFIVCILVLLVFLYLTYLDQSRLKQKK
jgi:tetratricopeptide (TPR) repeat protein